LSESSFPSSASKEALGHVVGISEHYGHELTYKVGSSQSDVIIYCSLLHPATPDDDNVHACMSEWESPTHNGTLKDTSNMDKSKLTSIPSTPNLELDVVTPPPPIFNPEDLIG
jgi:hypothetical protein